MRLARLFQLAISTVVVLTPWTDFSGLAGDASPPASPSAVGPTATPVSLPIRAVPPLDPDEQELVAVARDRFARVGLELPEVDISFHDDAEPCGGHDGIYRGERDRPRVQVCLPDRGTFASALERQRTLIHELAHAWEQANLDDDDRAALLEVLGADGWYAPEAAWEQRGAERFAETIVWGLYDQLRRPTFIDGSCRELHANFRAITGADALGPLEPTCELDPGQHETRHHLASQIDTRGANQ